jgi:hypothetical protein
MSAKFARFGHNCTGFVHFDHLETKTSASFLGGGTEIHLLGFPLRQFKKIGGNRCRNSQCYCLRLRFSCGNRL